MYVQTFFFFLVICGDFGEELFGKKIMRSIDLMKEEEDWNFTFFKKFDLKSGKMK